MEDYLLAGSNLLSVVQATILSQSTSPRVRCRLAANPKCPTTVLNDLAKDSNPEVRSAVGLNSATDFTLLDQLVADSSETVRFYLAGNAKLGDKRLRILMNDSNPYVAERALTTVETSLLEEYLTMLNLPATESRPLLGQLLVQANLLSDSDLKYALVEAKNVGIPLGNMLLAKRMASRYVLAEALLIQNLVGQKKLSFEEGVYFLKRETRIDTTNMFNPKVQHHLHQQAG